MIRKLLATAALASLCTIARAGDQYRFRGEPIQDGGTGFTVVGEKKDAILLVTSARYHYSLVLPWTDDWTFEAATEPLLKGSSGLLNLSLSVEESDESARAYLRTLQARLAEGKRLKGVEKSELVAYRDEPVLRLVVDAAAASGKREFRGVKMIHLHAAERIGRLVYVLHLSRVVPAEEAARFDDKRLLSFVTVGFRADFLRSGEP